MIISPGRKFIFVHIPKTGGTSVSLALEQRAMADDILIGDTPKAVKRRGRVKKLRGDRRLWKHSRLADVDGLDAVGNPGDYFVFTLVRNPWDRMVSYYHWLQVQSFDHRAVVLAKEFGFSDFLNHPETQAMLRAERYSDYVRLRSGAEVSALYVRLEELATDIKPLEDHLGFTLDIPHVNRSKRNADWQGYYSAEDAELVGRAYAEDIEKFGYRFER